MGELLKATLQEISADADQKTIGDPVPVQFNPSSLRLKLQNQTDGGRSRGRQRRQHNGASSTLLSMELVFDSADEGTSDAPVSVRTKTAIVEKYVLPAEDSSDTPPRLQFQWDQLIIAGIVESVDINFEHFAANGAPLRAKVSLSIKEQEPKYTFVEGAKGPAARNANNSTQAGASGGAGAPGSGTNENNGNNGKDDHSALALDGESAADFMARQGLDPSAWRGLGVDLNASLSFEAGLEVGFNASLNASAGVGVSVGVMASAGLSLEASLGLGASAIFSGKASAAGAGSKKVNSGIQGGSPVGSTEQQRAQLNTKKVNGDAAGLSLAAVGGVEAAVERLKIKETQQVTALTQTAFGIVSVATVTPADPGQKSKAIPLYQSQTPSTASAGQPLLQNRPISRTVSPILQADPRSSTYGYGAPLQPLYPTAISQYQVLVCTASAEKNRGDGGPAFRKQRTTPAWEALPSRTESRTLADQIESKRRQHPCRYLSRSCSCD